MTIFKKLVAVDPSLTCSGWAVFSLDEGGLVDGGVLSPPGPGVVLAKRLDFLQRAVEELLRELQMGLGDYLVCEGPAPLVKNPQSAIKVEHVRGIFETVARSNGVFVPGRINPRTVQAELLGMRGKQLPRAQVKQWARETAFRLHGTQLKTIATIGKRGGVSQDIIDAALIGTLALSKIQMASQTGVELSQVFAEKTAGRRAAWF